MWVSGDAMDPHLRLCIIAHTCSSGHCGRTGIEVNLSSKLKWSHLSGDVRSFVQACLRCLSTTEGREYPGHFDRSCSEREGTIWCSWATSMLDQVRTGTCTFSYYGTTTRAISQHFGLKYRSRGNQLVCRLWSSCWVNAWSANTLQVWNCSLGLQNSKSVTQFTLLYFLWSNGGIKRLGKELVQIFRSILSKNQMWN